MGSFKQTLQETIATKSLFQRNDSLLLSFSGGSDSVALAHALVALGYTNIRLLYFDHGLRSQAERDLEKRVIKNVARSLNLSYRIMSLPIQFIVDHYDYTIEAAGHVARYYCLKRFARLYQASHIVLAHHKDDLLETLLLQLDRGSVFHRGLPMSYSVADITFVRPLLKQSKKAILNYCQEADLVYSNDSTNQDVSFRRNYLRNSIIPLLSTFSFSFEEHLNTLFQRVQASYETPDFQAVLDSCNVREHLFYFECSFSDSVKQSDFYLGTALYHVLKRCFQNRLGNRLKDHLLAYFDCNSSQIELLKTAVMTNKSGEIVHLKHGISVYCYHQRLYLAKTQKEAFQEQVLCLEQDSVFAGYRISLKRCHKPPNSLVSSTSQCFVALPEPKLTVGAISKKDQFMPFNQDNMICINKALSKKGIQAFFREFCFGIRFKGDLVWVSELGVDNRFRVLDSNHDCYQLSCHEING